MSDKKLLPADLDPRNPSYAYKNKYKEIPYLNDANELKSLGRFNEII